jgi:hypothetical protein
MRKYKVLGINDEQTICDCCGRKGLKRTVALEIWENDENTLEIIRVGVDCAAILSQRNGVGKSAKKILAEATALENQKKLDAQWKADQLKWKIEHRIQSDIATANDYYLKQYPVYTANFKPHFGKLLSDGASYAWIPTINASSTEQAFISYLENNNFKPYNQHA